MATNSFNFFKIFALLKLFKIHFMKWIILNEMNQFNLVQTIYVYALDISIIFTNSSLRENIR